VLLNLEFLPFFLRLGISMVPYRNKTAGIWVFKFGLALAKKGKETKRKQKEENLVLDGNCGIQPS